MAFDFTAFFRQYRINFVTHGPSITRGNVAIKCPFCLDDPSEHMGVSTDGKGWHCWRRGEHRGRSPVRLVQALLGCTTAEAIRITGHTKAPPPSDILGRVKELLHPEESVVADPDPPSFPQSFRHLDDGMPASRAYLEYLAKRGYGPHDLWWLDRQGLRYASHGPWKGRIVFPVRYADTLISWTGRSIWPAAYLRYRTLSIDHDKAKRDGDKPALAPINHYMLWYDELADADADTFVACEGPFDALRINWLGEGEGIVASCLFTNLPTEEQVELLHDLLPRFRRRFLLLDDDMLPQSLRVAAQFAALDLRPCFLPAGVKDPGSLAFDRDTLLALCG